MPLGKVAAADEFDVTVAEGVGFLFANKGFDGGDGTEGECRDGGRGPTDETVLMWLDMCCL